MSATSQVFGSQNLSEKIFEFLPLEGRLACRNVNRDLRDNATAFAQPSRTVLAVRPLRESILAFLSPEDLDRSKRVKRSFNRNITGFQRVRLPGLFPEEVRDVVRRATFQIATLPPGWSIFGREDLCAAVVAGYFRGQAFLACKVDCIHSPVVTLKERVYAMRVQYRSSYYYWVDEGRIGNVGEIAEFITSGKYSPPWALPPLSRSCCERISDLFRSLFCCPKRQWQVYPQYHISKEP